MDKNRLRNADLTGATWWKASASNGSGQACVEVTRITEGSETLGMAVRDSKDRGGPVLRFTPAEWEAFVTGAQSGEMNL